MVDVDDESPDILSNENCEKLGCFLAIPCTWR